MTGQTATRRGQRPAINLDKEQRLKLAPLNWGYTFAMKLRSPITAFILCVGMTCWGGQREQDKTGDESFRVPKFRLKGKLARIFDVTDCKYISGMTCRIHYNGALPLPSRVFFSELGDRGQRGPRVRLIYPKLEPGETGLATFRIHFGRPTTIVLQGEWNGPWQDPY
jgi:hypothetical protein